MEQSLSIVPSAGRRYLIRSHHQQTSSSTHEGGDGLDKGQKKALSQAFISFLVYSGVLILVLGLVFTFIDFLNLDIVKNFLYKDFWHSMALLAVTLFYMQRMVRYLFREAQCLLRDFAGVKSYTQRLEEENMELKMELRDCLGDND